MRFLVLVGTVVLIVLLLRALIAGGGRRATGEPPRRVADGEDLVRDPVCETYVPRSAAVSATIGGEVRLFCSEACAERFRSTERPA